MMSRHISLLRISEIRVILNLISKMSRQTQGWTLTLNNPSDDDIKTIKDLEVQGCKAGLEVGESGTLHIQAAFYWKAREKKSLVAVRKIFPRGHWEQMQGNWEQQDYCLKDDRIIRNDGTGPSRGKRVDLQELREMAEEGRPLTELYEANFGSMIRYGNGIEKYRSLKMAKLPCKIDTVEWYYGPSGS